jgi:hypothetical protein
VETPTQQRHRRIEQPIRWGRFIVASPPSHRHTLALSNAAATGNSMVSRVCRNRRGARQSSL